jgi:hypothetical protein
LLNNAFYLFLQKGLQPFQSKGRGQTWNKIL